MAWTYDDTLPNDRDAVRLLVGDTLSTDPQMSDEEINGLLGIYSGTRATAIAACKALAAKYARYADKWVGDLKILASQKHAAYLKLAEALASSSGFTPAAPTAGGIYADQKQAQQDDESLSVPTFRRGMTDNEAE